jgi:Sec-independent protein translocase protein TatA
MGEFKKATNDIKDSMQLDSGIKEVKTTFNDLEKELKKPVQTNGPDSSETSTASASGEADAVEADSRLPSDSLSPSTAGDATFDSAAADAPDAGSADADAADAEMAEADIEESASKTLPADADGSETDDPRTSSS